MPEHKAAGWTTPIWDDYKKIVNAAESREVAFVEVERFAVGPSRVAPSALKGPRVRLVAAVLRAGKEVLLCRIDGRAGALRKCQSCDLNLYA